MPKSKKEVHDMLSPKIAKKRIARRRAGLDKNEENKGNIPPTVNNYIVNKPLFGPHKIKKKPVEIKLRKIGPMEGKAIVNTKVATKKNFIHKPAVKKIMDPASGSLEGLVKKPSKKPSKKKKTKNVK